MNRLTIDFGIDLGTTNSVVAVRDDDKVSVITNPMNAQTTPSAVYIDKRGREFVGMDAKEMLWKGDGGAAVLFKRRMGQDAEASHEFEAAKRSLTPEELSSEILKALRSDIGDKRDETPREIVITVPAAFQQHQIDATREAAKLAGFERCFCLAEPVAAALAYGLDKLEQSATWLIYDFGGGTFDAALVRLEDGQPQILNHEGDNFLGGSDIDAEIVERKIVPYLMEHFDLPAFSADSKDDFWRFPYRRLCAETEKAKIEACRKKASSLVVADELCVDRAGKPVDCEVEITLEDVATASQALVARTLELSKRAIAAKNVPLESVGRIVMVGGSTLSPIVRDMVRSELGRPLEVSIDPMTVVAIGAAMHAGTIDVKPTDAETSTGAFRLEITSPKLSDETPYAFVARLVPPEGSYSAGMKVELVDATNAWTSGAVAVRENGVLLTDLRLTESETTSFRVKVIAPDGTTRDVVPDEFSIRWGTDIDITLPHCFGVGLANGEQEHILVRNARLPCASKSKPLKTVRKLTRGALGETLRFPIYEGNNDKAYRNKLRLAFVIGADEVPDDIPEGSGAIVELDMAKDRTLTATIIFPDLGITLERGQEHVSKEAIPTTDQNRRAFDVECDRLRDLGTRAAELDNPAVNDLLRRIEAQDFVARINKLLKVVSDTEKRDQAEGLIRGFAAELDKLEELLDVPKKIEAAREALASCREHVERAGDATDRSRFASLETALERAIATADPETVEARTEEINRFAAQVREKDISWWGGMFYWLKDNEAQMANPKLVAALIRQGDNAIEANDVDGLKAVCRQLVGHLPKDATGGGAIPSNYLSDLSG